MVLQEGMTLAGIGVAIGVIGALALGSLVASLLFGVGARDPLTLVGGSLIFLVVAALATWIPATRAAAVPPAVALRAE
jgi:putative ABC transport system permease protein